MTSLLETRNLTLNSRFGPANLSIDESSAVAVIGPNGGGKTSLLRAIAGVDDAAGTVIIDGEDLDQCSSARRAHLMAFVPASRELVWPIAVRDLLKLGHEHGSDGGLDRIITRFELEPLTDRRADFLSTGERARVLLARAILARPRLLLLDEPMSNLDPYWVSQALNSIQQACSEQQSSALVVIHDLRLVSAFGRVLLVNDGEITFDGTPGELERSPAFKQAFRLSYEETISSRADRQSSP